MSTDQTVIGPSDGAIQRQSKEPAMSTDQTVIGPAIGVSDAGTLVRPNPGGYLPSIGTAVAGAVAMLDGRLWEKIQVGALSPLVAAAAPLLGLAARLKHRIAHEDVEALRIRVMQEIDAFERRIAPLGIAPRTMRASKYALCATIDDLVLNTPWGSRSVWTTRSLVGTFFSETWGGDRFFDLLAQLKKDPGVNVDLLELLYYCVSLGFEGKYRVAPRGASQLTLLREDLYRMIRAARGEFERDISPKWRGTQAAHQGLAALIPAWVMAAAGAGLLTVLYVVLLILLNASSDTVFADLGSLPPSGAVSLARVAPPPPPPPQPQAPTQSTQIRRFLEPEIREGLVAVQEDPQTITVRIVGAGMFASGSADVEASFAPLLARIGDALNDQPGTVQIVGHTDNAPVHSLRFPSNYDLSLARAKSVAASIAARMHQAERLTEDGRADSQPIASNDTPEGRQHNRRIEIVITKTA
jgi:type VI secretion system protein ImpK